jgi:hypothetical protein
MGCTGDCSEFRITHELTQKLTGSYYDPDNSFRKLCGNDFCWVEVEDDEFS